LKNNGPGKFSALILVECDLDCSGGGRIIKQQVVLCECGKAHTQKVIILMAHIWKRERAGGVSLLYPGSCTNWTQSNTREIYTRPGQGAAPLGFGYCSSVCDVPPQVFYVLVLSFYTKSEGTMRRYWYIYGAAGRQEAGKKVFCYSFIVLL
jgi:hypothetical protein